MLCFALTCKQLYNAFKKFRHPLLLDRIKRINKCRNEDKLINITLDRMFVLYPYHETRMLVIVARTIQKKNYEILEEPFVNLTIDYWKDVKQIKFKFVKKFEFKDTNEICWLLPFYFEKTQFDEDDFNSDNIWFAIGMKINNDLTIWDNNNGWNYVVSNQYHWIKSYPVWDKFPLMDYYYNRYIDFKLPQIYNLEQEPIENLF